MTETTASISKESGLKREVNSDGDDDQFGSMSPAHVSLEHQLIPSHPNEVFADANWTGIDQSKILKLESDTSSHGSQPKQEGGMLLIGDESIPGHVISDDD